MEGIMKTYHFTGDSERLFTERSEMIDAGFDFTEAKYMDVDFKVVCDEPTAKLIAQQFNAYSDGHVDFVQVDDIE